MQKVLFSVWFKPEHSANAPKKGATVPVAVWEVKQGDEANLDIYEGAPRFYYKKDMQIKCRYRKSGKTRTISAFVYIMHEDRQLGTPSAYYVNTCLDGSTRA